MMDGEEYEKQAKVLVDDFINNAIQKLEIGMLEREKTIDSMKKEMVRHNAFTSRQENYEVKDINWLTIQNFSVEKGQEKIMEYIQTWEYEDSWLYCIEFLGEDEHEFDTRYRYRVRWSIPTRRKPVPRATACVYFTFQVSKIKPKQYPVEVFYVFETNRLVHRPGESRFREKWLKDVIESKSLIMESVNF
ncbi:A-kinase anchor protein 14-like [Liolophura sinensis]|uniref:A-kinase anchor protein 14-like n=1 Tax=Liolophura sinensis TaxID=3198878 RepID=UPI00315926E3